MFSLFFPLSPRSLSLSLSLAERFYALPLVVLFGNRINIFVWVLEFHHWNYKICSANSVYDKIVPNNKNEDRKVEQTSYVREPKLTIVRERQTQKVRKTCNSSNNNNEQVHD